MPDKNALLSPSSSERWLNCPPSVVLCRDMPDETSAYAAEGTSLHALCEYKVNKMMGLNVKDT